MAANRFALTTKASKSARLKFFVLDAAQTITLNNQLTIPHKEIAQR
jgi:hypothetical protein